MHLTDTFTHCTIHWTTSKRRWRMEKREQKWGTSFVAWRWVEIFFFSVIKIPSRWRSSPLTWLHYFSLSAFFRSFFYTWFYHNIKFLFSLNFLILKILFFFFLLGLFCVTSFITYKNSFSLLKLISQRVSYHKFVYRIFMYTFHQLFGI